MSQSPATEVRLGSTAPLKEKLEELSTESRTAIQRLISEIASITGREATHTDPLDLFNAITSQTVGGLYVDVPRTNVKDSIHKDAWPKLKEISGGSGLAYHFWSDTTKKVQRLAIIFLKLSADPTEKGTGLIMASYLVTAIHEMTHVAPRDNMIFDHPEMDRAGRDLGAFSFDDYVEKHCLPSKYWSRP